MGKKRRTVKVRALGMVSKHRRKRAYAVFVNNPNGTEWRVPNTDTKSRAEAVKMAKKLRKERWRL